MSTTARLKHHATLVDRMATARGLDLQEAALRGALTPADQSELVLRCAGCVRTDHCAAWLDAQTGTTPDYCRNTQAFGALAKGSG
ncbi:DUF6455 family protein [uncultured Tateyamaria sp.]|uniref:DUF6455 family protein n=1 Tax=uncultured Tateyamaria sp. TaxID=455651 RepID=UPI0026054EF1|nr:DUF6455 family protein [uncultured Tateyamaria sp.]